jgi:hypothetical protein
MDDLLQRIDKVSRSVRTGNLQCSVGEQNLIVWRDDERYNEMHAAILDMVATWPFDNTLNEYVVYTRPEQGG